MRYAVTAPGFGIGGSDGANHGIFWNNTYQGNPLGVYIHNGTDAWIVSGRDYFNNTQAPGYTPYPYPHPLTQGGSAPAGSAPAAPTNLIVR